MDSLEKRMFEVERIIDRLALNIAELNKKIAGKEFTNVTCIHCGYSWHAHSKSSTLSCSSCGGRTPNISIDKKTKKKKSNKIIKTKFNKKCPKCKKKLTDREADPTRESNPNGLCHKCWGKIVKETDMSCFNDM